MKNKKTKTIKKKNPIKTFFSIFLSMVLGFCIIAGTATFAYFKYFDDTDYTTSGGTTNKTGAGLISSLTGRGIKTNVAVFGVDKDGIRTDVIFVVHFDSKKKALRLMSVPRDTRVSMTKVMTDELDSIGKWYPNSCKINEVHSYAPKDKRSEFSVMQLEDLLGISIDHYVKVDLEGFKYIVDSIGGVEVDVPQDMNYSDPVQGLYINLDAGLQTLDGEKAEQLVRFRSYKQGDVQRVSTQQIFLKALAKKIISTETIKNNLVELIKAGYEYVETDVGLVDAIKYAQYVDDVDMNNIQMETLPGEGKYVNKISYFIHDDDAKIEAVDRIFFGKGEEEVSADSKVYNIEIINGGDISGLAGKKQEMLEAKGFKISGVSNYSGTKQDGTRIVVKKEGMGNDLTQYFVDAVVEVNPDILKDNTEINIILGLKEIE